VHKQSFGYSSWMENEDNKIRQIHLPGQDHFGTDFIRRGQNTGNRIDNYSKENGIKKLKNLFFSTQFVNNRKICSETPVFFKSDT
jgi:hypothetical protein